MSDLKAETMPTTKIVSVKKSKWIKSSDYTLECPFCGFVSDRYYGYPKWHRIYKYCPNCGKKVGGNDNEQCQ